MKQFITTALLLAFLFVFLPQQTIAFPLFGEVVPQTEEKTLTVAFSTVVVLKKSDIVLKNCTEQDVRVYWDNLKAEINQDVRNILLENTHVEVVKLSVLQDAVADSCYKSALTDLLKIQAEEMEFYLKKIGVKEQPFYVLSENLYNNLIQK